MKKFILTSLIICCALLCALFSACFLEDLIHPKPDPVPPGVLPDDPSDDEDNPSVIPEGPHVHAYDKKNIDQKFLKSAATCTEKAKYYFSCSCRLMIDETFEYGELRRHDEEIIPAKKPTCISPGLSEGTRCLNCEQIIKPQEEVPATGHSFDKKNPIQNNLAKEATCVKLADYYLTCSRCGEKSTETFESGALVAHKYENGECKVCHEELPTQGITFNINTSTSSAEVKKYDVSATGVVIPDRIDVGGTLFFVTKILSDAFKNNTAIRYVKIPSSVTDIGTGAFAGCSSLISVTLHDKLLNIGANAFSGCTSLTGVTIPKSVISIGNNAFAGCSTLQIFCESEEAGEGWLEGWKYTCPVIWNCTKNELDENAYVYYTAENGLRYRLKAALGLNDKSKAALIRQRNDITEAVIPRTVEYKGKTYYVTDVLEYAFKGCNLLTEINLENIESVYYNAFEDCTSLTKVTFGQPEFLNAHAFSGCKALTVYFTKTTIAGTTVSDSWIDEGTPVIFKGKTGDSDGYSYTLIDGVRYKYKSETRSGITTNTALIARQPSNLTAADIPQKITVDEIEYDVVGIDGTAFLNCYNLKSASLPDNITEIPVNAFSGCVKLESVILPANLQKISENSFRNCAIKTLSIPANVNTIHSSAFNGCTALEYIEAAEGNTVFASADGILYDAKKNNFVYVPLALKGAVTVPASITSIADNTFENRSAITTLDLSSVTQIGKSAFACCFSLKSVTFSENLQALGDLAFTTCDVLKSVTLPDTLITIGESVFEGCKQLNGITVKGTIIGKSMFENCTSLTEVTIHDSVTTIGVNAFNDCSTLTIYCEAANKPGGWDAKFNGSCPVIWNSKAQNKDENGFAYAQVGGVRYKLKDGVATVTKQSPTLTKATIPLKITVNGVSFDVSAAEDRAFINCRPIPIYCEAAAQPEGFDLSWNILEGGGECPVIWSCKVQNLDKNGFSYEKINGAYYALKDGEAYLVSQAQDMEELTVSGKISFAGKSYVVAGIKEQAFSGCAALHSLTLPSGLKFIETNAFLGCLSLFEINFDGTQDDWLAISKNSIGDVSVINLADIKLDKHGNKI